MAARRRTASRRGWPPNLYQNAAGYYWFRNPENGKTFGLGPDFRVASAQVKTANAELQRRKGDVGLLQRISGGDISLRDWCDTYEKSQEGKPSTLAVMKSHVSAIREGKFSANSLGKITPLEIADFLIESEGIRGATTAMKLRARLLDLFREAIEKGLVEVGKNPVESVFKPKPKVTRQRLTIDDYLAIMEEARKNPTLSWAANAIELALITGQRREDILKIKFEHMRDGFLWVEQSKGVEGMQAKLRIPLHLRLDVIGVTIEESIRRCRDAVVSKYAVHILRAGGAAKPGKSPMPGTLSNAFAALRDQAKIKVAEGKTPPSFHELRSLAARLYSEQYGAEFAQALLGHKSAEMTALYRDNRGREWTEIKLVAR